MARSGRDNPSCLQLLKYVDKKSLPQMFAAGLGQRHVPI